MSLNLGSILTNSARFYPNRTALIAGSRTYTYLELETSVRRLAHYLKGAGIGRGDRVAIMVPNVPAFTISYLGVLYAGAVVVTLNTLQVSAEVEYQLEDCGAKVLVLHADCRKAGLEAFGRVEYCREVCWVGEPSQAPPRAVIFDDAVTGTGEIDPAEAGPGDTAVVLYTSGTTGEPKGAELTHFNLFYNAQYVCERAFSIWPQQINVLGPGHVALAALPLSHVFGQTNVQNALLFGGGAISYMKRFAANEALSVIERDGVTFFPGIPTMYFAILHDSDSARCNLTSLQFCVSGGAPMPADVKRRFQEDFGVRIQEGYGLTETSPLASMQRLDETAKCGTIGKPIAGVEMQVFDERGEQVAQGERGEIVIRGHNIMKGYFKRPEATAEAIRHGWFHSGDIGYQDAEGDLFIVDRKKEMILRGGYNVYPREVEEVLYTHPDIREAAVIGVSHPRYGEEVKAVVSLREGCQVSEQEIIDYCKNRVAAYKYPRKVEILPELPKGSTGKIFKRALLPSREEV